MFHEDRFEQISEHVNMSGKRDCLDLLARSVAPSISGYLEVKKVHWYQLFENGNRDGIDSITSWETGDRLKKRRHSSEFSHASLTSDKYDGHFHTYPSGLTLIPKLALWSIAVCAMTSFAVATAWSLPFGLPLRESCWCWWAKCSDFREEIQPISWDDPPTWCTT